MDGRRRSHRGRLLVVAGLVSVLVIAIVIAGVSMATRSSSSDQVAPRTTTVKAVTRDLAKTLAASGTVQFQDQRTIPFLSGASGTVGPGSATEAAAAPAPTPSSTTTTTTRTAPATSVPSGSSGSSGNGSNGSNGANAGTRPSGNQGGAQAGTPSPSTPAPTVSTTTPAPTTTTTTTTTATTTATGSQTNNPGPAIGTQGATRHVLTWLPSLGSTVERNQPLFRVDNQPTYLFFGDVPAYRGLDGTSTAGPDISQLQQNLVDLGFGDGVTVSGIYDLATYTAVARWEASVGLDGDGVVQVGEVAYAPGTARITGEPVAVGSDVQSGASIVTASSVTKVVGTTIDARQADAVKIGQPVEVTLPSQEVVTGKVIDVGTVATASGATAANASSPTPATVAVTVGFADATTSDALPDDAQVKVAIRVESHDHVLAVPAGALVPGPDGKPAVTLADSGQQVAVTPGLAADGMVEITNPPAVLRDGTALSIAA